MGLVLKNQGQRNVVVCPNCGRVLIVEPAKELHIMAARGMSAGTNLRFLGRVKCPKCKNQVTLHYWSQNKTTA